MTNPPLLIPSSKPDAEQCLRRIEAWMHQEILNRPPVRFYHHNIEFEEGVQRILLVQRVQAAGKSIIDDLTLGELEEFCRRVQPKGVFLCLDAKGKEPQVLEFLCKWSNSGKK
jgi:hypothetical protein